MDPTRNGPLRRAGSPPRLSRRRIRSGLGWALGGLLALGLATVASGVVVLTRSRAPRPSVRHVVMPSRIHVTVPHLRPAPLHASLAVEDAAVRRLAASGLPLYCGGSERRMVALTFDDGPGVYTHYAIDRLTQAHMRATFFLVGKEIRAWPGWAEREKRVAAFGDHTMTHPYLPWLTPAAATAQIADAKGLIAATVREPVVLFRPPYEGETPAIRRAVTRLGLLDVLWDVDSRDSLGANYLGIEHNVIAGLAPGSIIEMHENRGQTIRALRVIFAAIRRRHLEAVTLPELIAEDPPSAAQLRRGYAGCPLHLTAGNGT